MRLIAARDLTLYVDGGYTTRNITAGSEFEIDPSLAVALKLSGSARDPDPEPVAADGEVQATEAPRKKRRYKRRDMRAEG